MSINIHELTDKKKITLLMLCIGIVQIAGYYLAGMLASPDGTMAVPQPDTLLYCQAARRIAEGHPFSFSTGTAMSTGTTSVLYPFILAIPYILGAKGDALFMAGFWLNALFYLVFLYGWGQSLWHWLEHPLARFIGVILLAISGQPAFCAMSQSDIGCWMAVSALFALGLSMDRPSIYGPILILTPWIRPEGMICVIAFGIVLAGCRIFRSRCEDYATQRAAWAILVLATLSTIGVFMLNYAITGHAQFSSVANKGYFKSLPFSEAAIQTANDLLKIVNSHLFGLATSTPRNFIFPAFLSAVFIWLGILAHPWRHRRMRPFHMLLLAALGGIFTVAQSGWQGTNFDRYLVWSLPLLIIFFAEGLTAFTVKHAKTFPGAIVPPAACLVFFVGMAFVSLCQFKFGASISDRYRQFASEIDKELPSDASIATLGASGIAYKLGNRPFHNLSGIYSPQFSAKTTSSVFEIIKHMDKPAFDYWVLSPEISAAVPSVYRASCCGENILTGPDGYEVRKADWSAFNHAHVPHAQIPQGKRLVCRMDVGYEADESASGYETIDRYGRPAEEPFVIIDDLDGKPAIDAARLLVGGDSMTLPLQPGKDVTVVMRTYPKHTLSHRRSTGSFASEYTFANPLRLNVMIDNDNLDPVSITYATNGFSDVAFTLPGSTIRQTPCKLSLLGDHISAGYWFYQ